MKNFILFDLYDNQGTIYCTTYDLKFRPELSLCLHYESPEIILNIIIILKG
jgi:hypothetical protein